METKKASIISIGNELLNGQTVDTNSTWLSGKLLEVGIPTVSAYTIGDDVGAIKDCIEKAVIQADIILITGGLGPTDDDITRDGLAEFLSTELVFKPELLEKIKSFFAARKYPMPEKNKVQAYIPQNTITIENNLGTAPGILYKDGEKIIAAMPGVPSEMKPMMENVVLEEIEKISNGSYVVIKKLKCFGCGESTIAEKLGSLMARDRNPLINCTVDIGIITLHIVATGESKIEAEKAADKDFCELKDMLGDLVYGTGNQTLGEVVGQRLLKNKQTLALAESCTAGLISKWITDLPGASEFYHFGWTTYSGLAKTLQLDVPSETIEQFGQVSGEVAIAMAVGARKRANSDFAISVTGIAGPTGGTNQKPVGLVYIAIDSPKGTNVHKFNFTRPDRHFIRTRTAQTALNLLRLSLGV